MFQKIFETGGPCISAMYIYKKMEQTYNDTVDGMFKILKSYNPQHPENSYYGMIDYLQGITKTNINGLVKSTIYAGTNKFLQLVFNNKLQEVEDLLKGNPIFIHEYDEMLTCFHILSKEQFDMALLLLPYKKILRSSEAAVISKIHLSGHQDLINILKIGNIVESEPTEIINAIENNYIIDHPDSALGDFYDVAIYFTGTNYKWSKGYVADIMNLIKNK